jgi:hypothetical protein
MGASTSQTTPGSWLPMGTVRATRNAGWRLRFSQSGSRCCSAEVAKVSEVPGPKLRTAEITSYQIILGRTKPVYPPARSSDQNRKPCIAIAAVKTNGKIRQHDRDDKLVWILHWRVMSVVFSFWEAAVI